MRLDVHHGALNARQSVCLTRRIAATFRFCRHDHRLAAMEVAADVEAGLPWSVVQRRHWLRSLRFVRAMRPCNVAKIALLSSSITTTTDRKIA